MQISPEALGPEQLQVPSAANPCMPTHPQAWNNDAFTMSPVTAQGAANQGAKRCGELQIRGQ